MYSDEDDAGSKAFALPPQLVGEGLPEIDLKGAVVAKGDSKILSNSLFLP